MSVSFRHLTFWNKLKRHQKDAAYEKPIKNQASNVLARVFVCWCGDDEEEGPTCFKLEGVIHYNCWSAAKAHRHTDNNLYQSHAHGNTLIVRATQTAE